MKLGNFWYCHFARDWGADLCLSRFPPLDEHEVIQLGSSTPRLHQFSSRFRGSNWVHAKDCVGGFLSNNLFTSKLKKIAMGHLRRCHWTLSIDLFVTAFARLLGSSLRSFWGIAFLKNNMSLIVLLDTVWDRLKHGLLQESKLDFSWQQLNLISTLFWMNFVHWSFLIVIW